MGNWYKVVTSFQLLQSILTSFISDSSYGVTSEVSAPAAAAKKVPKIVPNLFDLIWE